MKKLVLGTCLIAFIVPRAVSQHGAAPNDYYPVGYSGDTWSGEVTTTNDETREITLTFTKGSKIETFTGVLQEGYKAKLKDGTAHDLKPSEIPKGTHLKVFYMPRTKKDGDKKIKYYEIFKLEVVK
jgi:hypothetical protein